MSNYSNFTQKVLSQKLFRDTKKGIFLVKNESVFQGDITIISIFDDNDRVPKFMEQMRWNQRENGKYHQLVIDFNTPF